jgi:hypothetical protein
MKKYTVLRDGEPVLDRRSKIILANTASAAINIAKAIYADELAKKDNHTEMYDYYYHESENAEYTAEEQK